ncbi:DUF2059 domain-containing protein [Massilia sp. R2A-15]|uniref:DUF2059 domain-containing protein n=1 Tax=Massilia sp. R2A-15 TaxID=3064278 RepID=UPI002734713B|nr:DUF2059 domain-containing protein [Massilia sp. R2A-15]WLI90007.1 DUF2059 domain-containing protein [Massilia sp. R2A-15]
MCRLLAVLLMAACSSVGASEFDERAALAAKVVELMRGPAAECNVTPEALARRLADTYRTRPGDFSGISPQSAYWPEVERIWREFYAAQCAEAPIDFGTRLVIKNYAARMSVQELRDAVAFFSSPSGRSMRAANVKLANDFPDGLGELAERPQSKASLVYRRAMGRLKEQYEANPR